jgi:type I restriction enzyme M protein
MDSSQIGNRAWSFIQVLREDGLSHQAYIEQVTFLLSQIAGELTKPPHSHPPLVSSPFGWPNPLKRDGIELEQHYPKTLEDMGKLKGMLGTIFLKAKRAGGRRRGASRTPPAAWRGFDYEEFLSGTD